MGYKTYESIKGSYNWCVYEFIMLVLNIFRLFFVSFCVCLMYLKRKTFAISQILITKNIKIYRILYILQSGIGRYYAGFDEFIMVAILNTVEYGYRWILFNNGQALDLDLYALQLVGIARYYVSA